MDSATSPVSLRFARPLPMNWQSVPVRLLTRLPPVPNTSPSDHALASFPACTCCGATLLPPVSDAPICYSVGGGAPRTIPRSQNAQLLRFLCRERPRKVVGDQIYLALGGCLQASRAVATLRGKRWGVPILCDNIPKMTKAGTYGLFYLGEGVRVWEPTEAAPNGEA